jgi:WD40-like Beta Propeller Repeat
MRTAASRSIRSARFRAQVFASAPTAVLVALATVSMVSSAAVGAQVPSSCPKLKPLRSRAPLAYFPPALTGLTAQLTVSGLPYGCVYVIRPGRLAKTPLWHSPTGGRLRGPAWAPDGRSFAVAQKVGGSFYVFKVDARGRVALRTVGRDFAFLCDGRLVIRRGHSIFIEKASRFDRLATEADLEHAAGFHAGFFGGMTETRGCSGQGVAIQWWAPVRRFGNTLLLIEPSGHVLRLTPRWRRAGTYMPGPPSWSPDGQTLMIPWQHASRGTADHIHCLELWSRRHGYRKTFCRNPHFDAIAWARDGRTALLNNGRIVSATGRIISPPRRLGPAFAVRWTRAR